MARESVQKRLSNILNYAPTLKRILLSTNSIQSKRTKIRKFLSDMLMATFDDNPTIPPLEWVLTRDAIGVFRTILSRRNERLAGFSFLNYIDGLLNDQNSNFLPAPSAGLAVIPE